MRYYTAHIIYRIICEGILSEQYEEQWRLVSAHDEQAALGEARKLGKEEEAHFVDRHGRTIKWEMIAVKDLNEICIENGALLISTVKEVQPIAAPVWALAD